jgi:glycerol-3-phosphate dehydrogenase
MINEDPTFSRRLPGRSEVRAGQVAWAVRKEMARTVEDFLARRTRLLILDARLSMEAAPSVAELMAKELGRDSGWVNDQVESYAELANAHLP